MSRRSFSWTNNQLDKLNKVIEVLNELDQYKPLTLRQVYYQLVGKGYIENNKSQYGMLSSLLKYARIEGYIPWDYIEDRSRSCHDLTGWDNSGSYISAATKHFLTGYKRDFLQTQEKYTEIWIEKDALSTLFTKVADPYGISVIVCRGFSSVSFLNEYKTRILNHQDKQPVMLYFGDFDPSGVEMLKAMEATLHDELGISNILFKRVALEINDIIKYQLPHSPEALKTTDTRAAKHIVQYGQLAIELDALRPDILEQKIRSSIEYEIDLELYNIELGKQVDEYDLLNIIKKEVESIVNRLC